MLGNLTEIFLTTATTTHTQITWPVHYVPSPTPATYQHSASSPLFCLPICKLCSSWLQCRTSKSFSKKDSVWCASAAAGWEDNIDSSSSSSSSSSREAFFFSKSSFGYFRPLLFALWTVSRHFIGFKLQRWHSCAGYQQPNKVWQQVYVTVIVCRVLWHSSWSSRMFLIFLTFSVARRIKTATCRKEQWALAERDSLSLSLSLSLSCEWLSSLRGVASGEWRCFARWGSGGHWAPPAGLEGGAPKIFWRVAFSNARNSNNFTNLNSRLGLESFLSALTCSCDLTWLWNTHLSAKNTERKRNISETREIDKRRVDRQKTQILNDRCLTLTGSQTLCVRDSAHGRSLAIVVNITCRTTSRKRNMGAPLHSHFSNDTVAFSGGSSFSTNWAGLFSFASFLSFFFFLFFSFFFFFFGTRLLTLRNLRYVAKRACSCGIASALRVESNFSSTVRLYT